MPKVTCAVNRVWCADITCIPMRRGFLYLVAIMDWATRRVLSWRLSNTMDTEFCIEALEDAFRLHGRPEIFNTDQGSQFTSPRFPQPFLDATVKVSMDGRGRWMDNVMIERLWRSLKYECVYLHAFESGSRPASERRPAGRIRLRCVIAKPHWASSRCAKGRQDCVAIDGLGRLKAHTQYALMIYPSPDGTDE